MTESLSIGPFTLAESPLTLRFGNHPVELSSAALDILAAIAHGANGASAAQLWPMVSSVPVVDEERLCEVVGDINIALSRWSPAWYVAWYPDELVPRFALACATRNGPPGVALPPRRTDIVGREESIAIIVGQLQSHRFVTIVGAGGMGKTTVALAAAHVLADRFADGVHLVDLAPIVDTGLVAQHVASAVGCAASGSDVLAVLSDWARDRRALVVFDSCEHVLEAVSRVAEALVGGGADTAVLATSREPLRAGGEWLHRLPPLRLPQPDETPTARQAPEFSALQLFIERAGSANTGFVLRDEDVPLLVTLCKRLDGIALAIEIVAARVGIFGLAALASQLESHLLRLPGGRRSAPERHNTLTALLDWSFELLSETERTVLKRLSVFRGGFTIEAAVEVIADARFAAAGVQEAVLDLIAKSLITPTRGGDGDRLRLLDTTRAYASAKLEAVGELDATRRRHAQWLVATLGESTRNWDRMSRLDWVERYAPLIDDVRAALDWAFAPGGDVELGARMTMPGLALGRQMLLIDEFIFRAEQVVARLAIRPEAPAPAEAGAATISSRMRTELLIACFGSGGGSRLAAMAPLLEQMDMTLADSIDPLSRFIAANNMWTLSIAQGDFRTGTTWAARLVALAQTGDDPVASLVANRIQTQTLHFAGRHAEAVELAHQVLGEAWRTIPLAYNPSPVELRVSMRVVLARAFWMRGHPERATTMALETIEQARTDSLLAQCQAIVMCALPIALWNGQADVARSLAARLLDIEPLVRSDHWQRWARRFREAVAVRCGTLVEALVADAFFDEPEPLLADHLATLDDCWLTPLCIQRVESGMVGWCAPEALRLQGERALREPATDRHARGEDFLQRSLALARRQGAAAWELRSATTLARHWAAHDRATEARALLEPIFERFTEGFGTVDLRDARHLLETL